MTLNQTNNDSTQDPLQQVYDDLAKHKTPSHFDRVLLLKGKAKSDFSSASEMLYRKSPQAVDNAFPPPKPKEF
ncbi:MAG: hypothetical protein COB14_09310 [Alphaproteobacteria bacterium]|nr:MAG: hypothetical protein COB14_09310 [Alphaproteobacteria bacterium]